MPISLDEAARTWAVILNELTYSGLRKAKVYARCDRVFGPGNWIAAHYYDGKVISRGAAYLVYEEGYYEFLKRRRDVRDWLQTTASEVYDIAPSNIRSGFDYSRQECGATHLQDISIRRALTRLALEEEGTPFDPDDLPIVPIFRGDHPVQIRGHTSEGYVLNPGKVPFHRPDLMLDTDQHGWWDEGSVEDFYQKNKVLLVDPEAIELELAMAGPSHFYFELNPMHCYAVAREGGRLPLVLRHMTGRAARGLYGAGRDVRLVRVDGSPRHSYASWRSFARRLGLPPGHRRRRIGYVDLWMPEYRFRRRYNSNALAARDPLEIGSIGLLAEGGIEQNYAGFVSFLIEMTIEALPGWSRTTAQAPAGTALSKYYFRGATEPGVKQYTAFKDEPSGRFRKGDHFVGTDDEGASAAFGLVFRIVRELEGREWLPTEGPEPPRSALLLDITSDNTSFRYYELQGGGRFLAYVYSHEEESHRIAKRSVDQDRAAPSEPPNLPAHDRSSASRTPNPPLNG